MLHAAEEAGPPGPASSLYHERLRSGAETVAAMRPHFAALGITRLARQTGLDNVGIPCFAAFRPNSRSIACNQGKGVDDDAARASAVMEATEYAIAEQPAGLRVIAPAAVLASEGRQLFDPVRALPIGESLADGAPVAWLEGRLLRGEGHVLVPLDLVSLNGERPDLPGVCQHTNGLASGNAPAEAIFHGTCELIERDAAALWSLLPLEAKQARCVSAASFADPLVGELFERFERAGLAVRLFDQTSDIGVPTILAVSGPREPGLARHFDIATGAGTHPDASRAALRALTEAAQTRVTSIAAARDDIRPDSYRLDGSAEAFTLLQSPAARRDLGAPGPERRAETLLQETLGQLAAAGITDLVAVRLDAGDMGIAVTRVLSNQLEDRGPNANWRPGRRALALLLEAA
jgi:ribosomal protein S12 methylthiotransferase accessory factor